MDADRTGSFGLSAISSKPLNERLITGESFFWTFDGIRGLHCMDAHHSRRPATLHAQVSGRFATRLTQRQTQAELPVLGCPGRRHL
jgi:hypothetical protein